MPLSLIDDPSISTRPNERPAAGLQRLPSASHHATLAVRRSAPGTEHSPAGQRNQCSDSRIRCAPRADAALRCAHAGWSRVFWNAANSHDPLRWRSNTLVWAEKARASHSDWPGCRTHPRMTATAVSWSRTLMLGRDR